MFKRLFITLIFSISLGFSLAQNTFTKQYELSGIEEIDSSIIRKATGTVKVKYNNDYSVVEVKYVLNPESYWHVIKLEGVNIESSPNLIICRREEEVIFKIKESGDGYSYILINYSKIKNKENETSN